MSRLTITGNIVAKDGHADAVRAALETLIPVTRAEAGCIQYELHQDNDNPSYFMFFENWDSRASWQAHMNADHLRAFAEATGGMVEKVWLHELTQIA